ncbi:MAG TPA: TIGR01212 family radical SAM protein [Lentimicrobium sp.]|nr:TIGR01212 family radical SAM protein [Lentimicrobium sp.]
MNNSGNYLPYNSYNEYFKRTFGSRVQKVSIDAGFTCPNRDGLVGKGGCTYCNNDAFNPSYCDSVKPVEQQINEGIEFHKIRYRRALKYLAYLQTYSNTYGSTNHLREVYSAALSHPDVIGLIIGTRPDCIDDEKLSLIAELSRKFYIMVEYGVETINEDTLKSINRGHTYSQSREAIVKTAGMGIKTGAHFIFGLPGESREEMFNSVEEVSSLPLTTIKFHQLQIVKNTQMAHDYLKNPSAFNLFTLEDYIDFIIRYTERLNPEFIIERFTGEVPPRYLVTPPWGNLRSDQVTTMIIEEMKRRDTWQGKFFSD